MNHHECLRHNQPCRTPDCDVYKIRESWKIHNNTPNVLLTEDEAYKSYLYAGALSTVHWTDQSKRIHMIAEMQHKHCIKALENHLESARISGSDSYIRGIESAIEILKS